MVLWLVVSRGCKQKLERLCVHIWLVQVFFIECTVLMPVPRTPGVIFKPKQIFLAVNLWEVFFSKGEEDFFWSSRNPVFLRLSESSDGAPAKKTLLGRQVYMLLFLWSPTDLNSRLEMCTDCKLKIVVSMD